MMRRILLTLLTINSFGLLAQEIIVTKHQISKADLLDELDVNTRFISFYNRSTINPNSLTKSQKQNIYKNRVNSNEFTLLQDGSHTFKISLDYNEKNERTLTKYSNGAQVNTLTISGNGGSYFIGESGKVVISNYYENWGTTYSFYNEDLILVKRYSPHGEMGFRDTQIGWNNNHIVVYTRALDSDYFKLSLLDHSGNLIIVKEFPWISEEWPTDIIVKSDNIILTTWGNKTYRSVRIFNLELEKLWDYQPNPPYRIDFSNDKLAVRTSDKMEVFDLNNGQKLWKKDFVGAIKNSRFPQTKFVSNGKYLAVLQFSSETSKSVDLQLFKMNGNIATTIEGILNSDDRVPVIEAIENGFLVLSESTLKIEIQ